MRILAYSHDTFGVGNIRRMMAICEHLHGTIDDISILIVTGSPMLHSFRMMPGIDYIKLPCLKRGINGEVDVHFLDLDVDDIVRLRSELILSTAESFRPDVVLVDKKPTGLAGELEPALQFCKSQLPNSQIVLILRDILDSPQATQKVWKKHSYYEALHWYFDSILILGTAEVFDATTEYRFPRSIQKMSEFCGYVRRSPGRTSREALRSQLGIDAKERMVLVTAGGGEDGYQLMDTYIRGLDFAQSSNPLNSVIITGPELAPDLTCRLEQAALEHPRTKHLKFTDDMMSYMAAADLVVSMGGYNTVCEILTLNKRAIVVPRETPVEEQRIRAERMAKLSLFRTMLPGNLTPTTLMTAVFDELSAIHRGDPGPNTIDMDALPYLSRRIAQFGASTEPEPAHQCSGGARL